MNWRISALDSYQLISNSDAHSPAKLGREANLFQIPLSYGGLAEPYPQETDWKEQLSFSRSEGKYHFDGHRKCSLCISPSEAAAYGNICPVCGKKLTIGVLHRVEQLADRKEDFVLSGAKPLKAWFPSRKLSGPAPENRRLPKRYWNNTNPCL